MGGCLSLPSNKTKKIFQNNESFDCSMYSTPGHRSTMEDRTIICPSLPKHTSYSLFAVFDGFNGHQAATYMSQHIVDTLDNVSDLESNHQIINAINQMDDEWIHSVQNGTNSGCTFVLVLVHSTHNTFDSDDRTHTMQSPTSPFSSQSENEFHPLHSVDDIDNSAVSVRYNVRVFWAGDSRAMLMSNNGTFETLTVDHHCDRDDEAQRISNADGNIINKRIDGICEVTRAFGCYMMKNNDDLPKNKQKLISDAECMSLVCTKDDMLVIFCDGLLKKWSENEFTRNYRYFISEYADEPKGLLAALTYLCEQAMDEGSKDNLSVIAVKLK